MKARTIAVNQIKHLLISAPDAIRAKCRALSTPALIAALQRARPPGHIAKPEYTTQLALKNLGTRYRALTEEIAAADNALQEVLDSYASLICNLPGGGARCCQPASGHSHRQPGKKRQRSPVRGARCGGPQPGIGRKNDPPPA